MLKSLTRKALRTYLTYTPIKKGRYPLMMLIHGWAGEPVTVEVTTKDRGKMKLELDDIMQFPIFYNLFEAQYDNVVKALLKDSDITIDVGGNVGQYALLFAEHSKKVYTFEPMPKMIGRLEHHIQLNQLEQKLILIPKALSKAAGILKFELPESANSGTASTVLGRVANSDQIIEVEAMTFDDFADSENINGRVDLIKIDIEGAEFFAIQGMKRTLSSSHQPILILEMNDEMMGLAGYSANDVQVFLSSFGYEPYEITKRGLRGPDRIIRSDSENYCFMTKDHTNKESVSKLIYE
jgi:FkbM family methyltransferase